MATTPTITKAELAAQPSLPPSSPPGLAGAGVRGLAISAAAYLAAALIAVLVLARILKLWHADLSVPFDNGCDAMFGEMWVKGIRDHGWYLQNPSLGAPSGLDMRDFPLSDSLHFGLIKLLVLVTPDFGTAFNLYFLLGFPLTTLSTLFVLRRFGVSWVPATAAGLLYTFIPYHWFRGENHLFLSSYFIVPLSVMVALWLYQGQAGWARAGSTADRRRGAAALMIALVQSSAGIYYAFFACYLFLVAGAAAALDRRRFRPLGIAVMLVAVTSFGVLANIAPSLAYWRWHGPNTEVARRTLDEAEIHGLKIGQLLLPPPDHRLAAWASTRAEYDRTPLADGEKRGASLGVVGSLGFLFLVGMLLSRRNSHEFRYGDFDILRVLAVLNIFAVLLATVGGFGSLFSLFVSPQIRAYNRISVVVAAFSLFAVALLLERAGQWWSRAGRPRYQFQLFVAALTVLGVIDEAGRGRVPDYAAAQSQFKNDAQFVARIEAALRAGAMVYQLPYARFPEFVAPHALREYEHFRPYLHSRALRWSYGAMKGRAEDLWQRELAARPLAEQVRAIAGRGFRGIYIDRHGFADRAAELESGLRRLLDGEPIESGDRRMSFYLLRTATDDGLARGKRD